MFTESLNGGTQLSAVSLDSNNLSGDSKFICLSVCLSIYIGLSVCLSVCLDFSVLISIVYQNA